MDLIKASFLNNFTVIDSNDILHKNDKKNGEMSTIFLAVK